MNSRAWNLLEMKPLGQYFCFRRLNGLSGVYSGAAVTSLEFQRYVGRWHDGL